MRAVTLIDGREVDSASREWLLETLARKVLAGSLEYRRAWLASMEHRGDKAGADELRDAMKAVHEARKADAVCLKNGQSDAFSVADRRSRRRGSARSRAVNLPEHPSAQPERRALGH